jgi:hypothetical protein
LHTNTSPMWVLAGGSASGLLCNGACSCCHCLFLQTIYFLLHLNFKIRSIIQLSATDISVQASMKGAAKCDNHCELQNSVNQWILERALHFWVIPGSMSASVLVAISCKSMCLCLLRATFVKRRLVAHSKQTVQVLF